MSARVAVAAVAMLLVSLLAWEALFVGELAWGGLEVLPVLALPLLARTGAWQRWLAFLAHREDGTSLAVLRIGLGACLVWTLVDVALHGLVEMLWVDRAFGGYRRIGDPGWLVSALGGATPAGVWRTWILTVLGGAATTVGLGGRLAPLIGLFGLQALTGLNGHAGGSYDELLSNALWLLVLAPATTTLSVDARLRTGRWVDATPVAAWPRALFVLQLFLCYWTTGLQKLSHHWSPGGDFSALFYILQQPTWHRFDMAWLARIYPLTQVATAITWLWEVSAPVWLLATWYAATPWKKGRVRRVLTRWRVREGYAVVGLGFHLVLLAVMELGPFSLVTLAYYPALFRPDELLGAWRWLTGRSWRSATDRAAA